jgi:hypothetical protein
MAKFRLQTTSYSTTFGLSLKSNALFSFVSQIFQDSKLSVLVNKVITKPLNFVESVKADYPLVITLDEEDWAAELQLFL